MKTYKNYISLGYNCYVALDLSKLGLRAYTYPFDWIISDIGGVVKAIENHFENFMNIDNMKQSDKYPNQYYDTYYKFWFMHDFNNDDALEMQIPKVKMKYDRRIERLYNAISEPTLFIRYIDSTKINNGNLSEVDFLEENHERILKLIKEYNKENEIIYVGSKVAKSKKIDIYSDNRKTDKNNRKKPLWSNLELYKMLSEVNYPNKEDNIEYYKLAYEAMVLRNNLYNEVLREQAASIHLFNE